MENKKKMPVRPNGAVHRVRFNTTHCIQRFTLLHLHHGNCYDSRFSDRPGQAWTALFDLAVEKMRRVFSDNLRITVVIFP